MISSPDHGLSDCFPDSPCGRPWSAPVFTWGNATATETLNMFTQRLQGMGDASLMVMKQLSQIVCRQAVVMGYGVAFFILTLFYLGLSLRVMLLKKPAAIPSA